MRTRPRLVPCLVLLVLAAIVPDALAQSHRLTGTWQGLLDVQMAKLRIVFHLQSLEGDGYRATLDSPDQGAAGIPVDTVIVSSDSLHLILRKLMGRYDGRMEAGDSTISGHWTQAGRTFVLPLHRSETVELTRHPQEPKPPFPYTSEEVTVVNADPGVSLAGTLTRPAGTAPVAAVVLITGSGPQDRNEMILGHKPFLLLADVLTRRGIAVLRCDDRGVGGSTGSFATATTKDFATDVHEMVRYLRSRSDIRHDRIGLIGHSEGGLIAPIVASESKDVAFLVLMAGPSLTGAEIIRMQDSLINAASGASPEQLRRAGELDRKLFEIIQANPDTAVERAQIRSVLLAELRSTNPAPDAEAAGMAGIRGAALTLTTPWMRYFLFYDPAPALRRVTCPVLAIDGSLDLQVPPDTNLHGIERALREGGNTNVRIRNFPGLNHLFQTAKTGLPGEYSSIEETIAPEVLTEIGDWVSARAK